MLLSELIRILLIIFFAFGGVTTIFIIVRSISNYSLADSKKLSVLIRFVFVVLIWAAVSIIFFLLLALSSMGNRIGSEPEMKHFADAAGFISAFLFWLSVGGVLIYWTSRPPKLEDMK